MTLRHMKIFVTVCASKSVTEAARKLYIAQPSVSLAIKELEEHYGVRLFDRISKRLYLTEHGKQLLNYATHIISLFDRMEMEIQNPDSVGTLRVGSSITIGNYFLPDIAKQYKRQYPHIDFYMVIDNSNEIEKKILSNEIDIGLIEGRTHDPHVKSIIFRRDELVLICGKNHPLAEKQFVELSELEDYEFILRERGSGGRELFDSTMMIHNVNINQVGESVSNRAIIKLVQSGMGISVLPYLLVEQEIKKGSLRKINIKDVVFEREFYIIYHENKFFPKSVIKFIELCKGLSDRST